MPEGGEELEQQPDGLGLEHDGVGARPELGERLRRDLRSRPACERPRVERRRGARRVHGVAAAAVAVAAEDLHERVADAVVQAHPGARGDRGLDVARGPHAERLERVVAGDREGVAQRGGRALRVQAGGVLVEAVVLARRRGPGEARLSAGRRGLGEAGVPAAGGGRPGEPRVGARARARRGQRGGFGVGGRRTQGVLVEPVRRGHRDVPVAHAEDLDARVVDRGRLRRRRAREARHQRALAHDRDLRVGARERKRALGDRDRIGAHATPTSTSRKRAGAAPCETRITWPGSPLPQLPRPRSRHSDAEQTASRPPQKRGVIPA